jgi:hypothetical protein
MPTTKAGVRKSSAHSTRGAVAGEIVVGGDPTDAGAIAQLQGGSFRSVLSAELRNRKLLSGIG